MSDVKWYGPFGYDGLSALMHEDELGGWVRTENYEALEIERDALAQRCRELEALLDEHRRCNHAAQAWTNNAELRAEVERLQVALHDLDNRHSNNCHYMAQFKQRIQKLLGTEEDNWFALLDLLEAHRPLSFS